MGTSSYLNESDASAVSGYFPVIAVSLIAVTYHVGLGPIPWSYTAELFPIDVRAFMSGFTQCVGSLYIFLVVKTYPEMSRAMTPAGVYWFYAGVSGVLTSSFALLLMPETKGKQFEEIAEDFSGGNTRDRGGDEKEADVVELRPLVENSHSRSTR